jgi:hypothetical protein
MLIGLADHSLRTGSDTADTAPDNTIGAGQEQVSKAAMTDKLDVAGIDWKVRAAVGDVPITKTYLRSLITSQNVSWVIESSADITVVVKTLPPV